MLQLEIADKHGPRIVSVGDVPFSIGRSSENSLQLSDSQVSRRHAEIVRAGEIWRVRDCGSRFGTWLNDTQVGEADIKPGDRIKIGQTELRVGVGDLHAPTTGAIAAFDFRQMNALLAGLRALGSSKVLDEVLLLVLDSALELTGAERGFILLADAQGELTLTVARARGGITLKSAQTSRRIPEQVFATGNDTIVTDLLDDEHAAVHMGTVALGIRHVLCTPLQVMQYGDGTVRRLGVLYLDSRERGYLQHAGALQALAGEAAVAIENARLYREVVDRERATQELRIAAEIQRALLPPSYYLGPLVELAASMTPCRDVGGDFFDYVEQPDGALMFAVGDVAGKGTSAALLTAVVQGLFTAEVNTADDAGSVIARVNKAICRRAIEARFVTAFYGQLSVGGRLRYCNAGHNAPFLLSSDGVQRLEEGGVVLGLFRDAAFGTGEVQVSPGSLLVLFSDGVTEAVNADDEEFGDERLSACLEQARSEPARGVLERVQSAVRDFCGATPARDDVTVMALCAR